MKPVFLIFVFLLGSVLPVCCCCSTIPFMTANPTSNMNRTIPWTPTPPPSRSTPIPTRLSPPTEASSDTSPAINAVVNVPGILGKTVTEIETTLGSTIKVNPINDPNDSLSGGEYRDYIIGRYLVFIGYDQYGIARMFQVLEGLESSDYSIREWNQILPIFGVDITTPPSRTAPAAVYWDNYNGLFIAVAASSTTGSPVWTVQIAQAPYAP